MSRRNYHRWTEAEDNEILGRRTRGETSAQIARAMNKTRPQIENRFAVLRAVRDVPAFVPPSLRPVAAYTEPEGPTLAEVFAPEASADEPEEVFLSRILTSANRSIVKAEAQRHATLRIASRVPIALSISSDWHLSPTGTDVEGLLAYADYCAETPGLYAIAVGDLLDNPIKHNGGNVAQLSDDLRLLDVLVGRFRGKLLGTTSGNHDDWSKQLAGTDHLHALAKRHKIHYAPDELLWKVEIVNPDDVEEVTATYRVYTRHQWRRGSALNPCHACWTWWQEEGMNWDGVPDVMAIGHNHIAAVESRQLEMRDAWAFRMGAWQKDSAYARAKGFARYRPTAPTAVLPAEQGRVMGFADPADAVRFMHGEAKAA